MGIYSNGDEVFIIANIHNEQKQNYSFYVLTYNSNGDFTTKRLLSTAEFSENIGGQLSVIHSEDFSKVMLYYYGYSLKKKVAYTGKNKAIIFNNDFEEILELELKPFKDSEAIEAIAISNEGQILYLEYSENSLLKATTYQPQSKYPSESSFTIPTDKKSRVEFKLILDDEEIHVLLKEFDYFRALTLNSKTLQKKTNWNLEINKGLLKQIHDKEARGIFGGTSGGKHGSLDYFYLDHYYKYNNNTIAVIEFRRGVDYGRSMTYGSSSSNVLGVGQRRSNMQNISSSSFILCFSPEGKLLWSRMIKKW